MLGFKQHQEVLEEKRKLKQDPDLKKKTETGKEKSVPAKTYAGMGKSKKEERYKHFKEHGSKHHSDSSAYKPAPGDEGGTTRKSKHTLAVHKKFGKPPSMKESVDEDSILFEDFDITEEELLEHLEETLDEADFMTEEEALLEGSDRVATAIKNKAEQSGVSATILRAIYNRGLAAWRGSHRKGAGQHQWAMARINSVLNNGPARQSDKDLWSKHLASKKKGKPKTKPSTSSKPKTKSSRTPSKPRTSGGKAKLHP